MDLAPIFPDAIQASVTNYLASAWPDAFRVIAQGAAEVPEGTAKAWRAAVTAHPEWPAVMKAAGINSGQLGKSDCMALGYAWSVDPGQAPIPAKAETAPAKPEPEAETAPAQAQGQGQPTPDERAGAILSDVLGALGRGDFATPRKTLADLIEQAEKPAPAPVTTRHPAPGEPVQGPVQVLETVTLADAFPNTAGAFPGRTASLPVTRYTGQGTADELYRPDPAALAALAGCDARGAHVWLYGPAGTGKSTLPAYYAASLGRPFFRIAFDRGTEAEDLIGGIEPDGKSGMAWRDGALTQAIRQPGAVILLDEPTVARPSALFMLQTLLDGGREILAKATGERIAVAPGVVLVAADNTAGTGDETGQYAGTGAMNRAFLDRMALRIFVGYQTPAKEARIVHKRTGLTLDACRQMAEFAGTTRQAAERGDLSHALGMRRVLAWAEAVEMGFPAKDAFAFTCIAGEAPDDAETLHQMAQAHCDFDAIDRIAAKG